MLLRVAEGLRSLVSNTATVIRCGAGASPTQEIAVRELVAGDIVALSAGDIAYRIHEDKLHTDAQQVVLTYVFRPDEADFPPFFASALVARLAAEFCIPLTESASRAELLYRLADREMREARLVDSQQDTPRALAHFPLISARG